MALSEFDLIREFFSNSTASREDIILGVGDDCALLQPPPGKQIAVTSDTLVEGVHFFPDADPESLGHKSLAVNLSDLAAMGAEPAWVSLALTMPKSERQWLEAFSKGFLSLANNYKIALVGGDTTSGPLSITVTAHGFVDPGRAVTRSGAQVGDLIYVTGTLGDAGLALLQRQGFVKGWKEDYALQQSLDRPLPRISAGLVISNFASSAIDISDGLISDLGHICNCSGVGARVNLSSIPLSSPVSEYLEKSDDWGTVVASGDDYELCVTVPVGNKAYADEASKNLICKLTCIGEISAESDITFIRSDGSAHKELRSGYQHFT